MSQREKWRLRIPITGRCNLACSYCYNRNKEEANIAEQKKQITSFLKAPGTKKEIIFFGGEPLIKIDDLNELVACIKRVARARKAAVKLSLCTNLTVFNLAALKQFDYIYVSLDGTKKSHDKLRRPENFDVVFNNLKKLKGHKDVFKKIRINKVIAPGNVKFLRADFVFLKSLKIPFDISLAAGISGWDKPSLANLKIGFDEIVQLVNKNFERGDMASVLFYKSLISLPGVFCPFSSVTLNLSGQPTFCEFTALSDNKDRISFDNHKNKKCFYDLNNKECLLEKCLKCGLICQKLNLTDGQKLKEKDVAGLKRAGNFRNVVLKKMVKKYKLEIPKQIGIINCRKNVWPKAINFVILLERFLKVPKDINFYINPGQEKISEKLEAIFLKNKFSIKNLKDFDFSQDAIFFDCFSQDAYFLKAGENKKIILSKNNFIGNIKKGIFVGNLKHL